MDEIINEEAANRDDIARYLNIICPIRDSIICNASSDDNVPTTDIVDTIKKAINAFGPEEREVLHNSANPFKSIVEFILIALVDGCSVSLSEETVKLILFIIRILYDLKESDPSLKIPATDYILNYTQRVKNRVPILATTKHEAVNNKTGQTHTFYMNKVSAYIQELMRNPIKSPQLSALPDYTSDELSRLPQGDKWKTHTMFQHPMVTLPHCNVDVWVGNVVELCTAENSFFLIKQFFDQKSNESSELQAFAKGFEVFLLDDSNDKADQQGNNLRSKHFTNYAISTKLTEVPLFMIVDNASKSLFLDLNTKCGIRFTPSHPNNFSFDVKDVQSASGEVDIQQELWEDKHFAQKFKRVKADGSLMKVVNVPITLFTDDTSGNISKQYNLFDSYLMSPAAMSFESRGSKNNTFFICTANKNLSAVDMLPPLVDDLCALEEGIEMYSVIHDDYVLVVAPLLFIQADNYRHSELTMHKGSCALRYCRKCIIERIANPNPKPRKNAKKPTVERTPVILKKVNHIHPRRTIDFLHVINNASPDDEINKTANRLSYTKNGSQELLRLKSYDGTLDTPIELLHTLTLGIGKFLVQFL